MSFSSSVKNFLYEYFWLPVADPTVYYNPYNTVVYALLFGLAAIYLGYPLIKKIGLDLDKNFFIGIGPYVFLGGFARSLRDIQAVDTVLLETPFIYIVMFLFTVTMLLASVKIEELKEVSYHKPFSAAGVLAIALTLPFYSIENFSILIGFVVVSMVWIAVGALILRQLKPELLNYTFTAPIAAHFFDATSTYVGITLAGAEEKHVLADSVMQLVGPSGIFLVKAGIIIPVVWIIYNDFEGEKRNYYMFLIAMLGFAITTRNMLSIL